MGRARRLLTPLDSSRNDRWLHTEVLRRTLSNDDENLRTSRKSTLCTTLKAFQHNQMSASRSSSSAARCRGRTARALFESGVLSGKWASSREALGRTAVPSRDRRRGGEARAKSSLAALTASGSSVIEWSGDSTRIRRRRRAKLVRPPTPEVCQRYGRAHHGELRRLEPSKTTGWRPLCSATHTRLHSEQKLARSKLLERDATARRQPPDYAGK